MYPNSLDWAHPIVREWFTSRFGEPTEPQACGWPHIHRGTSTLVCAPTGSGKTLAAFLACIDRLVRKGLNGELQDRTEVLYVSPLKALSNDIQKNLEGPLAEIVELAAGRGLLLPPIRTAVRTGDTHAHARREMLLRPPHILVTTPESLYILLTARKSRENLRTVETVIVDEIHAVADDKRGAHLALSLERLDALTPKPPVRIGLSATQKPIELIGSFLTGSEGPLPQIVQVGHARKIDVAIEVPRSPLGAVATHEEWDEIYNRVAELAGRHRSTLVFVNTRRLAERVAHHLAERLGADAVATHHGSLARSLRLAAERKLKAGEIKLLVATASLELGIDIGTVDLVCQIGSPRSISVAWQRIGRAGHWRGALPKGRIFATTRNELLECAALIRAMRCGDLDSIVVPDAPLDVLAQQIVAACAADDWKEDHLFALVRRAFPYRALSRSDFDAVLEMLSGGLSTARGRFGTYLHRDRVNGWVRGRRGSRLAAITNGGAIPDNALYTVIAEPDGAVVGTIDEDFAVESLAGDVMLLGNSSWRIRRVQMSKVIVEDARGAAPTIPFWRGEAPARTDELSRHVSDLRSELDQRTKENQTIAGDAAILTNKALDWLRSQCGLDQAGAEQLLEYVQAGRQILGCVPTQKTIVAERFFDESGGMQLIIHAPFGGRINKAWGLALRKRFCRSFNLELQAAATDDGINISLGERHSFPLADVFRFLHSSSVTEVLKQAVLASPIFTARWRWDASRSLALLRFNGGKKVPPNIQRMKADDLLSAVFPDAAACPENLDGPMEIPSHPLVREAMRDALTEAMDVDGLRAILEKVWNGEIQCVAIDTPVPSQFCHEILNANPYAYLDDAPLEERRARAVEMRRVLPETMLSEIGRLDPEAIATVRAQAWPDVRNAEELHDALLTFVAFPENAPAESADLQALVDANAFAGQGAIRHVIAASVAQWQDDFRKLAADNRAFRVQQQNAIYWVAAERIADFRQLFPDAKAPITADAEAEPPQREAALVAAITGWLQSSGPVTASLLAETLGLPESPVTKTLLAIESSGAALRGKFEQSPSNETQWCDRRLLARIHRLTLEKLRKEIEPVTAAQFISWLSHWQHVAPGSQVRGERGLLDALAQLQGFEAPANSWERNILSKRVLDYEPGMLDLLCLTGRVAWGRLSPHPAASAAIPGDDRRITPTSVAPITFFLRDEAEWVSSVFSTHIDPESERLSPAAKDVFQFLLKRGASFFSEIVRGAKRLKSEVEAALWELVAAGVVTADSFDNLRAMLDPKRRSGSGRAKALRPRDAGGRWSLLLQEEEKSASQNPEALCRILLNRYGIVFREMLARESAAPPWREVVRTLRRMEDRGEIRGGRFVSGVLSEQFALPIAVESLRAFRSRGAAGEEISIAASDPLNLVGIVLPGEKVPANSNRTVVFRDGIPADPPRDANQDAA